MTNTNITITQTPVTIETGVTGPQGATGPASAWGTIPGTLSDQTDLAGELAGKAATADVLALTALPYSVTVPANALWNAASAGASQGYLAASIFNVSATTLASVNGYMEWTFFVAAGTYTLRTIYYGRTDGAIITISIDGGAALGTSIDSYMASNTLNNVTDITGIALAAGRHTVRFTGATKNASSSNFRVWLHGFNFHRTGA